MIINSPVALLFYYHNWWKRWILFHRNPSAKRLLLLVGNLCKAEIPIISKEHQQGKLTLLSSNKINMLTCVSNMKRAWLSTKHYNLPVVWHDLITDCLAQQICIQVGNACPFIILYFFPANLLIKAHAQSKIHGMNIIAKNILVRGKINIFELLNKLFLVEGKKNNKKEVRHVCIPRLTNRQMNFILMSQKRL